jgi:putative SOS response-associated peptidase YedK
MCGRFVSASTPERIAAYFGADTSVETLGENFNVAPTNDIYGVVADADGHLELQVFHWGLVPVWAKDRKIGQQMINARAETIAEKPAFKGVFKKAPLHRADGRVLRVGTRCGGWPRHKAGKPVKRPHFIHRVDGEPLAVAGIWSAWRDKTEGPDAPWLHSAAVVTTSANGTMAPIHDRMPVVLPRAMWGMWLDPTNHHTDVLSSLLVPAPDTLLEMHEVSTDVQQRPQQGPHLITPATPGV